MKYVLVMDEKKDFFKLFCTSQIQIIQLHKDPNSNPEKGKQLWIFLKDFRSWIVEVEDFDVVCFASFLDEKLNEDKTYIIKANFLE